MKKLLTVFLAFLLTLTLVACVPAADGDDAAAPASTTTTTTTASSSDSDFVKPDDFAAVLEITINPQFRLYLDKVGRVLALEFVNADALSLSEQLPLSELQAPNANFANAVKQIVSVAHQGGFVAEDAVIQLTLSENKAPKGLQILEKSEEIIGTLSTELQLSLTVKTSGGSTTTTTAATASASTTATTAARPIATAGPDKSTRPATATTTKAPANKNPQTELEYFLEYIGNFQDNGNTLVASALQFESGDELIAVVTDRYFEAEKTDPAQVSLEYGGKKWYSVGGAQEPHKCELTSTEIIVKGCLWDAEPDAENMRLVLLDNGKLKVTSVGADLAELFPVGTELQIYFR